MNKFLKFAVIFAAITSMTITSFAAGSKEGGGGGGGSRAEHDNTMQGYESTYTQSGPESRSAKWNWTRNELWKWFLEKGGHQYRYEWADAVNPYAENAVQTFFFDGDGVMLTGWHWLPASDGMLHCYYFNPNSDGSQGKLQKGGTTPDGYQVNEKGEWVVEGIVQTRPIQYK